MDATQYKQAILQTLDAIGGEVTACADAIHGYAELSGEEHRSAAALEELLEHHGFAVERGLKDLPTAFRAVYGSGPVLFSTKQSILFLLICCYPTQLSAPRLG